MLVYLRKGETFVELTAGFDISTSTAWRYVNETVELLTHVPKLEAQRSAECAGHAYVILDGMPSRSTESPRTVRATWASEIVWIPGVLPGSVHDTRVARILSALQRADLIALTARGCHGVTDHVRMPNS